MPAKFLVGRRVSPHFASKRNQCETEAKMSEAKQKVSLACFALKRNEIFCMRNEMTWSEKYRKFVKIFVFLNSGIWLEYIVSRSQHKEYVATTSSSIPYVATTLSSILCVATTSFCIPYVATTSSSITMLLQPYLVFLWCYNLILNILLHVATT